MTIPPSTDNLCRQERTYHAWNYASKEEMERYGRRYNSCGFMYATDRDGHVYSKEYYKDDTARSITSRTKEVHCISMTTRPTTIRRRITSCCSTTISPRNGI